MTDGSMSALGQCCSRRQMLRSFNVNHMLKTVRKGIAGETASIYYYILLYKPWFDNTFFQKVMLAL